MLASGCAVDNSYYFSKPADGVDTYAVEMKNNKQSLLPAASQSTLNDYINSMITDDFKRRYPDLKLLDKRIFLIQRSEDSKIMTVHESWYYLFENKLLKKKRAIAFDIYYFPNGTRKNIEQLNSISIPIIVSARTKKSFDGIIDTCLPFTAPPRDPFAESRVFPSNLCPKL